MTWTLVDAGGDPLAKTLVVVTLPWGTLTVTSDDSGAVTLEGLPPGEANLTID
jgi:hypothetical protein